MAINKQPNGKWLVELYPNGRNGRRIRKQFTTKGEALSYERHILDETVDKPWLGEKQDKRLLSELVDIWYRAHGITLSDGKNRKQRMLFACKEMSNPLATEFDTKLFSVYREKRLNGNANKLKPVTPSTVNNELAYFRAMFNELYRLGEWNKENPLKNIRAFNTDETEMAFLSNQQIITLLDFCAQSTAKDLLIIVKIALSTGARWSEAAGLTGSQITPYKITFTQTKGKRNRTVPITKELYDEIPKRKGKLFSSCYSAFRRAVKRAGIELPSHQSSHVMRHTFASHFMMSGGNIIVLQKILGHTDIKMTMRYAHFAPDHLNDALIYNPLSQLKNGDKVAAENLKPQRSSALAVS
ncbi:MULTISPECIES: tyrosine-type recombinase/integrase [Photorhabdus]|uniref:Tyrosine-type recombinase/integrase n=3 Tax=Photorhabdus TaxID=29487 RepID=A0ABX0B234_9GAMM|nr:MULTISPECIES: tyrosine-type recombinase/integrase [Photorhabdus]AKH63950.1 integrase [Photorhabdus thracensis]MCC8374671.1 tyrosine-type recombinase/integrase [Photorhabdus bodei]MDB6373779.1 tyrosine-type recombinase/integrase [Photorhabdus bodei]NDL13606.1 tyrosine-type recombinase/integrase [Photorhabdus kayaii]NDL27166.1 tyrosine-type recombinase/integrase [Photorhabdus kayaii]